MEWHRLFTLVVWCSLYEWGRIFARWRNSPFRSAAPISCVFRESLRIVPVVTALRHVLSSIRRYAYWHPFATLTFPINSHPVRQSPPVAIEVRYHSRKRLVNVSETSAKCLESKSFKNTFWAQEKTSPALGFFYARFLQKSKNTCTCQKKAVLLQIVYVPTRISI